MTEKRHFIWQPIKVMSVHFSVSQINLYKSICICKGHGSRRAQILVEYGADIEIEDNNHKTAHDLTGKYRSFVF